VAAVTAVQGLPLLVIGAELGVIVDRGDRRRLMVTADILCAVMIAALAAAVLVHDAGLALIYVTAFTLARRCAIAAVMILLAWRHRAR
jgi:hypothetical protein